MNPGRGTPRREAGAPNRNAGSEPAFLQEIEEEGEALFREGTTPQDRIVSFACRPFLLTIDRSV
ncbi:MAG TPA: hypothetical protein VNK91_16305 [Burkholderiaceae bacterium]|nr:hypothetical protein [Burkholderiaceae bacterium]